MRQSRLSYKSRFILFERILRTLRAAAPFYREEGNGSRAGSGYDNVTERAWALDDEAGRRHVAAAAAQRHRALVERAGAVYDLGDRDLVLLMPGAPNGQIEKDRVM
jgi:hypothetical protein